MEVTRTSLRSERNQIPPQVRQGTQTQQKGGYGEEVKKQGQEVFNIRSERPVIQAKKVDPIVSETQQYTKDAVKTALEKLKKFIVNQGLGEDDSGATEQTTPTATTGGGGGGGGIGRRDFFSGMTNDQLGLLSTDQLVARDNRMYGDTFPDGSFGIGSKSTDDFSKNPEYQSTKGDFEKERLAKVMSSLPSDYKQTEQRAFDDAEAYRRLVASGLDKTVGGEDAQVNVGSGRLGTPGLGTAGKLAPSGDDLKKGSFPISTIKRDDQAERMGGQGGLALGTTTQRQGGTVKDGIKVAKKESPAVNASSFLQKNIRGGGKDESARPAQVKQTVASLPSNYKATEKAAFDKAKAYKASKADSKAKGDAAAKATNTPSKPPAGSFGISAAGKKQAEANKAEKKKATPAQKTAIKKSTTVKKSSPSTTKSSPSTSKSGSKRSSRGAKSGGSKSGGSKSGGSKSGGSKSGGSKSAGSKKSSRGAKGSSSSRSKGGTSKGTSRRSNTRRSRRRCDIRCKFDISILTNQNLIRDDLADVAYFVKDLQEIN